MVILVTKRIVKIARFRAVEHYCFSPWLLDSSLLTPQTGLHPRREVVRYSALCAPRGALDSWKSPFPANTDSSRVYGCTKKWPIAVHTHSTENECIDSRWSHPAP